jgi:hypothetical protein
MLVSFKKLKKTRKVHYSIADQLMEVGWNSPGGVCPQQICILAYMGTRKWLESRQNIKSQTTIITKNDSQHKA